MLRLIQLTLANCKAPRAGMDRRYINVYLFIIIFIIIIIIIIIIYEKRSIIE